MKTEPQAVQAVPGARSTGLSVLRAMVRWYNHGRLGELQGDYKQDEPELDGGCRQKAF